MRPLLLPALLTLAAILPLHSAEPPAIDTDRVMKAAARKLAAYDAAHASPTEYANHAKGATWSSVPPKDWVSGFYPGCLWFVFEYARENQWPDAPEWQKRAEKWTMGLESQQFNTTTHDTGFMIFDSFGNGHRLTKNPAYPPIILQTAQSLAKRYLPATGTIRSWGKIGDQKAFNTIIDNMMNLELLVWSSQNGGTTEGGTSEDLLKIATGHADRTIELFIRPDGSTYHVVDLNPLDGSVVKRRTHQGKADESTWSRGQTWAMFGFGYMFEVTGKKAYLDTAIRTADFYLKHLPADFVPPSDFDSTLTGLEFKDSSAAAIATCALLRLSRLVPDADLQKRYFTAAENMLRSLCNPPYFSESPDKASILLYTARNYHEDPAHALTNTSLIFGDYYLLEALLDYRKIKAQPAP